jgi:hypothetical protein
MTSYKDIKIGSIIRIASPLNKDRLDHLFILENVKYLVVYNFRNKGIWKLLKHESFISQMVTVT